MTKQFFHGRTEAIRPVSQESNLFVRKLFDLNVEQRQIVKVYLKLASCMRNRPNSALPGKGVDRHFRRLLFLCVWKRYLDIEMSLKSPPPRRKLLKSSMLSR